MGLSIREQLGIVASQGDRAELRGHLMEAEANSPVSMW